MKNLSLILLILLAVKINAQVVNIPDATFKKYLVENKSINSNNDTEIQVSEALATSAIQVIGWNKSEKISDLTGIEAFENLTLLNCPYNKLTSIDVSKNLKLENLTCHNNLISGIDLSKNINLKRLEISSNKLTSLSLKNNINLEGNSAGASASGNLFTCVEVNDPYFALKYWGANFDRNMKFSKNCNQDYEYPSVSKVETFFECNDEVGILKAKLYTKNIPDGVYTNQFCYQTYVSGPTLYFIDSPVTVTNSIAVVDGLFTSNGFNSAFFSFIQESSDCLSTINENDVIYVPNWDLSSVSKPIARYNPYYNEQEFCSEENGIASVYDLSNRFFSSLGDERLVPKWFKSDGPYENLIEIKDYDLLEDGKFYSCHFVDQITGCTYGNYSSWVRFIYLNTPMYNGQLSFCSNNSPDLKNTFGGGYGETKWFLSETGFDTFEDYKPYNGQTLWLGEMKVINTGDNSISCFSKRNPHTFTEINPAPEPILDIRKEDLDIYVVEVTNPDSNYDYLINPPSMYYLSDYKFRVTSGKYTIDMVPNNYYLSYDDKSYCTSYYQFEIKPETLSNLEFNNTSSFINFSPNPTQGKITFTDKVDDVKVFDLGGRIVKTISVNTTEVDLSDLQNGVYMMQVNQSQKMFTTKVVKE